MKCSRHPAFCGFHSSKQLTRLNANSKLPAVSKVEVSASSYSFSIDSPGSHPFNTFVDEQTAKDLGDCYGQILELSPLQDVSPVSLTLLPALSSFLLTAMFASIGLLSSAIKHPWDNNDIVPLLEAGTLWNRV